MGVNAILPGQVLADGASDGDLLTVQADGSVAFETPAGGGGGIGGSTGSTDNAILRADGTGGSTLQDASWIAPDNYTASPNATVNICALEATGATTNVGVAVVPKGTGSFSLQVPDGTATAGNARGANAVDLRTATRGSAADAATGERSFLGPFGSRASGYASVSFGGNATGNFSFCAGLGTASGNTSVLLASTTSSVNSGARCVGFARDGGTLSGSGAFSHGSIAGYGSGDVTGSAACAFNGASATATSAKAFGFYALADRYGMSANASGSFSYASFGEVQGVSFVARNKTTDATATELFLDGSTTRLTIPSGKVLHATVHVIGTKSDGSAIAIYQRQVAIANVGGATSLVGTVNTIGSDTAASTSLSITADDTNDSLKIEVTGIAAETWRWVAGVSGVEIEYGT